MKKSALLVAAMIAALSVAGQAFARGGGMGGGMSQAGFSHQFSPTTQGEAMSGMQPGMHHDAMSMTGATPQGNMAGAETAGAATTSSTASANSQPPATATPPQTVPAN